MYAVPVSKLLKKQRRIHVPYNCHVLILDKHIRTESFRSFLFIYSCFFNFLLLYLSVYLFCYDFSFVIDNSKAFHPFSDFHVKFTKQCESIKHCQNMKKLSKHVICIELGTCFQEETKWTTLRKKWSFLLKVH